MEFMMPCTQTRFPGPLEEKQPHNGAVHRTAVEFSETNRKTVETCSLLRRVHISVFWGKADVGFYVWKRPSRLFPTKSEKKQPLWWYGGASVPMPWVKVPLMRRLMLEFWRDRQLLERRRLFPGNLCRFQQELQQRGFMGIECVCLTGLPTVQICLLLKMYGASWRGGRGESDHGLLSSLYTPQMWCYPVVPVVNLTNIIKLISENTENMKLFVQVSNMCLHPPLLICNSCLFS